MIFVLTLVWSLLMIEVQVQCAFDAVLTIHMHSNQAYVIHWCSIFIHSPSIIFESVL